MKTTVATFATAEERRALAALETHGSAKAAGAALGISGGAVRDRVRRAIRRHQTSKPGGLPGRSPGARIRSPASRPPDAVSPRTGTQPK